MIQIILILLFAPISSFSQSSPSLYASQPLPSQKTQELEVHLSHNLISPFYDSRFLGLSYRKHFNRKFSWQVLNVDWVDAENRHIEKKFHEDLSIALVVPPQLTQLITSELSYTPFIFKWNFLDQDKLWSSVSFDVGLGQARWKSQGEKDLSVLGLHFTFDLGKHQNLSWGIKNLIFRAHEIEPEFLLSLGYQWSFHETASN